MLPGFSAELMPKGREKESSTKIKRYMTMMDSMTNEGKSRAFYVVLRYVSGNMVM
jgi:signal recognition particle GTPase